MQPIRCSKPRQAGRVMPQCRSRGGLSLSARTRSKQLFTALATGKSNLNDEAACTCSYSTNAPTRVCGYVYAEQTRAQSRHTCPSCLAEVHRLTRSHATTATVSPTCSTRVRVGASDPNPLQCGSVTACRRMQPDHRQGEGQRVRRHESEPGSQRHALLSVALEPGAWRDSQKIEGGKDVTEVVVWIFFGAHLPTPRVEESDGAHRRVEPSARIAHMAQ
jgi:hypothetical protein